MNTNSIPTDIPYVSTLLKYNDALAGLPSLPVVVIGCIVLGYMCKLVPVIANKWIPTIVFLCGILMNLGIQKPDNWVRSMIFGLIAGAASIVIHRKLLKGWIDADVFPAEDLDAPTKPKLPSALPLILLPFLIAGAILVGCATVKPGNDVLVVRTEQFLTTAQGTLLFTMQVDSQDPEFWAENAPAFHEFVDDLRTLTTYQETNTLPRWRVGLLSLNDMKNDYKAARVSSNALFTALSVAQSLQAQAGAWLTIVTNHP